VVYNGEWIYETPDMKLPD